MSDDVTQPETGEAQPEQDEQQGPMIQIELTREGLKVSGNQVLKNPVMSFGMLEMAKVTIQRIYAKQNESPIARVPFMPPGLILRQ